MIGKGLSKTMQGNEEAITKMIRNYDKLNNDTRKKWRVTNYHKKNNKINILLQAIEYERKHCEVEEHQYKERVKMEPTKPIEIDFFFSSLKLLAQLTYVGIGGVAEGVHDGLDDRF